MFLQKKQIMLTSQERAPILGDVFFEKNNKMDHRIIIPSSLSMT